MRGGGGGQGSSAHDAAGAREATTPWGMPRDRGEVEGKAQAPVGESTWLDVRMKWLRKTGGVLRTTRAQQPACRRGKAVRSPPPVF